MAILKVVLDFAGGERLAETRRLELLPLLPPHFLPVVPTGQDHRAPFGGWEYAGMMNLHEITRPEFFLSPTKTVTVQ
jgi:hypothetical protein